MRTGKDVRGSVHGVQGAAKSAQDMETAEAVVRQAGEALREIVEYVRGNSSQGREVAPGEGRPVVSAEISQAVEEISRVAAETDDAVFQAASAAEELFLTAGPGAVAA